MLKAADYGYKLHKTMNSHVSKILVKYLESVNEDHRLAVLYLADGLLIKCNRKIGKKDKYRGLLKEKLPHIFELMKYNSEKDKKQLTKVLVKWRDFGIFSGNFISILAKKIAVELPTATNKEVKPKPPVLQKTPNVDGHSLLAVDPSKLAGITDVSVLQKAYEHLKSQNELLSKVMTTEHGNTKRIINEKQNESNKPWKRVRFDSNQNESFSPPEYQHYDKKPRFEQQHQQRNSWRPERPIQTDDRRTSGWNANNNRRNEPWNQGNNVGARNNSWNGRNEQKHDQGRPWENTPRPDEKLSARALHQQQIRMQVNKRNESNKFGTGSNNDGMGSRGVPKSNTWGEQRAAKPNVIPNGNSRAGGWGSFAKPNHVQNNFPRGPPTQNAPRPPTSSWGQPQPQQQNQTSNQQATNGWTSFKK